jgi:RimJ/RimL family protein N-acetyltransferase
MDKKQFIPKDFVIPPVLETEVFRLRMLSVDDVEKDYEAVMETQERFLALGYGWPREGFTVEENLADLEQHQREFLHREAFAYTVVSLDGSRVLGCVYINPPKQEGVDASIWMWVRESEYQKGLDPILFREVKKWIDKAWPFRMVIYPQRE